MASLASAPPSLQTRSCNILVVLDPTAPRFACIAKAVRLAVRFSGRLELFSCDTEAGLPESLSSALSVWDYRRHLRIRRLHMLETLAEPLRLAGWTVHTSAIWSESLTQGIVDFARHAPADWIVKFRDEADSPQALLSEADTILMQKLPCALLLVRSTAWPDSPTLDVFIGSRLQHTDDLLIDSALSVADRLGGKLDLADRQRPSIMALAAPVNARSLTAASTDTIDRLRHCDLLVMKPI